MAGHLENVSSLLTTVLLISHRVAYTLVHSAVLQTTALLEQAASMGEMTTGPEATAGTDEAVAVAVAEVT